MIEHLPLPTRECERTSISVTVFGRYGSTGSFRATISASRTC